MSNHNGRHHSQASNREQDHHDSPQPTNNRIDNYFNPHKHSIRDFVLGSAKMIVDDRQYYTKQMSEAQGRDVIKYLLTLNTIECQGYVSEIQLQAHRSFTHSFYAGIVGLVLVIVSIVVALWSRFYNYNMDIAYITGVSGIITQFISVIFLSIYYKSLNRMDKFHDSLRDVQKEIISIFVAGLVDEPNMRRELDAKEIEHLRTLEVHN